MAQKILVLDDEENYAEMLESLLEQHLFVVDSATKPELALKALEQKGYALVISDYKMPVMDGADFLQKAREINPDLPFIIVSGLMNTPELVKVANMGVTLVLEKPIDIGNFITQVKKFVQPLTEEEYARTRKKEDSSSSGRDLGDRKFIKTYPEQSPFLLENSPVMQFFLQDLWDAVQEQDHVFISVPPGSECDLLLAEIARWKCGDKTNPCFLDVSSPIDFKEIFSRAAGKEGSAGVVGVGGFTKADLKMQEKLVDAIREAPESLTFIYFLEQDLLGQPEPRINEELLDLIKESLCRMPRLQERPSDLAAYTLRYLPRLSQVETGRSVTRLEHDAIPLMLAYSWPGNFAELILVLRRALCMEKGESLTAKSIQAALQDAELPDRPFSLESELTRYQAGLLNQALAESGDTLPSLLETLGVENESGVEITDANTLSLLYPELIHES